MKNKIEFIAFDADDTLWENELYFQELEHKFCHLLRKYSPAPSVSEELFKTEIKNLHSSVGTAICRCDAHRLLHCRSSGQTFGRNGHRRCFTEQGRSPRFGVVQ